MNKSLPNLPDPFKIEIINTTGKRDIAFSGEFSLINNDHHLLPVIQMLSGLMPSLSNEEIELLFTSVTKDEVALLHKGNYLIRLS